MACANLDKQTELVAKVAEINRFTKVLTPDSFSEDENLTSGDYTEFVRWLLASTEVPTQRDIECKLWMGLRKIRMTRWHVYLAQKMWMSQWKVCCPF